MVPKEYGFSSFFLSVATKRPFGYVPSLKINSCNANWIYNLEVQVAELAKVALLAETAKLA